ncbi:MAG TPA: AmmeMemoRadiSam system radical SAM enzyme [Armatimonadota bacterium]|nr:AmmeMemoRadiSam system radical SAM enzyme [Armatimonadota bacterium]
MKEALLYEKLGDGKVRCGVCRWRCVIPDGGQGVCATRLNRGGVLHTLLYGRVASICADPIEKKPLYHFHPGTMVLSLGTVGCNFRCPGCQNYEISQVCAKDRVAALHPISPEESVELALANACQGICWTYNEPAIWFEHTLESARLAKARGLYTVYVTNGFISPEALDAIGPYLDAYRVDIKAFSREAYRKISGVARFEGILESAVRAREHWGMHVECVTNVTPTVNDDPAMLREIACWIRDALGPHTPWHITRFFPYRELSHLPPTPIDLLEQAHAMAREEGLAYAYLGNVAGHGGEDTHCHACGARVIQRRGMGVTAIALEGWACHRCKTRIPGRFEGAQVSSGLRHPVRPPT